MSFLPRDFDVPEQLETERFRLRSLTIHDLVKDYDAVMSSLDHLWAMFGEQCKAMSSDLAITYRPGSDADSYTVFHTFEQSLADLLRRMGSTTPTSIADPQALARMWTERRSLYTHLTDTADQFWVAEKEGQVIGFARSVVRGSVRELTELFVLPGQQSGGVGRELIKRAFPPAESDDAEYRSIIATTDFRAQALYLKSGVYPRFPIYYFGRQPQTVNLSSDLTFTPSTRSPETLEILGKLDEAVLGHRRDADHTWFLNDRQGYLYYRNNQPVGYGYVGVTSGPFALLDTADYPAVLAHAESQAAASGREHFGLEIPVVNQVVVDYLLARDFQLDTFMAVMMTNKPFGKFENYILTSPSFFM